MKPVYEDGSAIASNKLSVSKGDILCNKLNMKFKRIWRVDADLQNSICSTEFVPIQAVNVDRNFLYYILTSDDFTSKMSGMRTGTSGSHQRVSVDWILDYEFNLPGIETQQRIGALLGQIDSRIRNNAQLNDYLAALAEGIFEDWLQSAEGELTPLSRFAAFNPSTYSPKEKWPIVVYVDTGSVTSNHFEKPMVIDTEIEKLPSRARRKVVDGDVIYSTVRPNQLHYGLVVNPPSNMLVSTGFTVIRDVIGVGGPFIFLALTRPSITTMLQSVAEQSTSAYPSIKSSDLEQLEIPLPTREELEEIKPQLDSLFAAISHNQAESKVLEELRDALLPKLMSGEIDVSDIELPKPPNNHLPISSLTDFGHSSGEKSDDPKSEKCCPPDIQSEGQHCI